MSDFRETKSGIPYDFVTEQMFIPQLGRAVGTTTLTIPGAVCRKWDESGGNICPFCGFPPFILEITNGEPFIAEEYWEMHEDAMSTHPERLMIFNGGSFFPESELPLEYQRQVLDDYNQRRHLNMLCLETRPEYFTHEVAQRVRRLVPEKPIMIMVGLESVNHVVRNNKNHLLKAMPWKTFLKCFHIAKAHNMQVFAYVMLGAPGLSPAETFADARNSALTLTTMGIDEMVLQTAFVPPDTKIAKQYEAGLFNPPSLWSTYRLMQESIAEGWPLRYGGVEDIPPPLARASGCKDCDTPLLEALTEFRKNGNLPHVQHCACQSGALVN